MLINVPNTELWLGNAADLRDIRSMLNCEVAVIIDLAAEEPVPSLPRSINYCRFCFTDDGNDPTAIAAAITTTTLWLRAGKRTAICCNAGMNRSPAIAAAALASSQNSSFNQQLESIAGLKPIDVNPALLIQVSDILKKHGE